jgi:putative tryptophan/tyrosine transport system substrate-binding protein
MSYTRAGSGNPPLFYYLQDTEARIVGASTKFEFIINLKGRQGDRPDNSAERAGESGQSHQMTASRKQKAVSSKTTGEKRMTRPILVFICLLLTVFLLTGRPAEAQQPSKIPRIGYLSGVGSETDSLKGLRQGLRDLRYVEGKNILVEFRFAEGQLERLPSLVAELVQLKVDVVVAAPLSAIRAAKQATKTIPIVMVTTGDPVATGLIDSLARPGGNITGLTRFTRELSGKRLELLKEVVPTISRVAVLWDANVTTPGIALKEYEAAAPGLKLQVQSLEVRGPNPDLEGAFQGAVKRRANALVTILNPLLNRYRKQIAELAIKHRLPSMYEATDYVEAGGLMSYSASDADLFRRAAVYVDKILKGAKPVDLPVEQPTKFELLINLKTAKQIGLTIPQSVLYRADKVLK